MQIKPKSQKWCLQTWNFGKHCLPVRSNRSLQSQPLPCPHAGSSAVRDRRVTLVQQRWPAALQIDPPSYPHHIVSPRVNSPARDCFSQFRLVWDKTISLVLTSGMRVEGTCLFQAQLSVLSLPSLLHWPAGGRAPWPPCLEMVEIQVRRNMGLVM